VRSLPALTAPHSRVDIAGFFGLHADDRRRAKAAVALSVTAVAAEIGDLAGWFPSIEVGRIVVSASVVPAALLVLLLGRALLGRSRHEYAAVAYWACVLAAVLASAVLYRSLDHASDLPGLLLATADEELVFRLAVPGLVAVLLCLAGVRHNRAWILGFLVSGVWFVTLPGHRGQWNDALSILAFAAFATVMAFVVYRSGSVAAAALAHLCADLLTILMWNDVVARAQRSAVLGIVLVLLVIAYGEIPRRARSRSVVIDLRDGHVPSLQRGDATAVPIVEPAAVPIVEPPAPAEPPATVEPGNLRHHTSS
jgi:hypothetical protein